MSAQMINDRFLAVIFVILASLAAIHIMGRRSARSDASQTRESRPKITHSAESQPGQDRPAP